MHGKTSTTRSKKVAHRTKTHRKGNNEHSRECQVAWKSGCKVHGKNHQGSTKKMQRKSLTETVCQKNCEEECTNLEEIKKRKQHGIFQKKKEIRNLQRKVARGNHDSRGTASWSQVTWQQGQRARRRERERDDQKVVHGKKNQHCDDAFSGTGHGPDGILKLVECCKRYVCEETGCSPDWKDQELVDNRSDVRNVRMTRDHYAWRKKKSQEWRVAHTLSDIDDEFVARLLRITKISSCFNSFVFNSWNTVIMEMMWMWLTSMVFCPATW